MYSVNYRNGARTKIDVTGTRNDIRTWNLLMVRLLGRCNYHDIIDLIDPKTVSHKNSQGMTPLMVAAGNQDDPEIFEALLVAGANTLDQDENGWTAFMFACLHGKSLEILELLLEAGSEINHFCKQKQNALLAACAAENCSLETIEFLLDNGADRFQKSELGLNAIDASVVLERSDITRLFRLHP